MSLPDQAAESYNPFAPPSVRSSILAERQQWGWQRVGWLLSIGFVLQVVLATLTIHFLRSKVLGIIETPYLHLFVTVSVTVFVTGLLLRGCQFFTAVIASQLMNLVQWSTFVATAIYLKHIDFTSARLTTSDKVIFFCIYLCAAAVIAIICWLVRLRRRRRVAEVMVP